MEQNRMKGKKKKAAWYFFHIYIEDELKALKILLTKILKINVWQMLIKNISRWEIFWLSLILM